MLEVVLKCLTTGQPFTTGIFTDARSLGSLKTFLSETKILCPHCRASHLCELDSSDSRYQSK